MKNYFPLMLMVLLFMVAEGGYGAEATGTVGLTIYNDNLALVKDVRPLAIESGVSTLRFTDVAAKIDPTSVHLKNLDKPLALTVLEQNFEYDLVSADRLLEKYIDQQVLATLRDGSVVDGMLMSANNGQLVIQTAEGLRVVQRGEALRDISLAKLPAGLMTRPTLMWKLKSEQGGSQRCELTYLTEGISWKADYVAVVDQADAQIGLSGWVTIDNKSGATYTDAKLKLIAGDVNRVQEMPEYRFRAQKAMMAEAPMADAAGGFKEKSFFEYHMYTLGRPATVADRQQKQVNLLSAEQVPVKKVYIYDGAQNEKKVNLKLEFKNSEANHLGMPLPKGKVRAYKADEDGSLEFVDEDEIDHTPKDEMVRLLLGNAFDVVGERKLMDQREISVLVNEESYEIRVRNHKKEAVTVTVQEHHYGDWKVITSSHPGQKKGDNKLEFALEVQPDAEVVLTYTVRINRGGGWH